MTPNSKPPSTVARVDAAYAPAPALPVDAVRPATTLIDADLPRNQTPTKHLPHTHPCPSCKADFGRSWGCTRCGSWYRRDAR